jgi:hypothetical protein
MSNQTIETPKATRPARIARSVHVPHALLDAVREHLHILTDAELGRVLGMEPGAVSEIRRRKRPVGYSLIVAVGMKTDWLVKDIVALSRKKP